MQIQQTEDYSSFKRIKGNRTINKAQVTKLFNSLGESPELAAAIPVIVNDKMEIIDGQHRFQAVKKLGLPVNYIKIGGLSLRAVQILNSATKIWTPLDYAKSYSEMGLKDYDVYLEFRKKYHLGHNVLISYLSTQVNDRAQMKGSSSTVQTFRAGKFKVSNVEVAHKLCRWLVDMQTFYKRGDNRSFALAFKVAALNPQYDHQRMMDCMRAKSDLLKDSPYAEDYMRQLERIYNYRYKLGGNRVKLF